MQGTTSRGTPAVASGGLPPLRPPVGPFAVWLVGSVAFAAALVVAFRFIPALRWPQDTAASRSRIRATIRSGQLAPTSDAPPTGSSAPGSAPAPVPAPTRVTDANPN